jgi:hypothetical protein
LIRNLWNQIAATRQGCPWMSKVSIRGTGRPRNVGLRFSQRKSDSGCRTEGDIETPIDVISMPYALRFCETESEFVRLASKTSRN